MDFRKAVIASMKAYYQGRTPEELRSSSPKKMKYSKKYFDRVGADHGIEEIDPKKKKEYSKNG